MSMDALARLKADCYCPIVDCHYVQLLATDAQVCTSNCHLKTVFIFIPMCVFIVWSTAPHSIHVCNSG